MRKLHSEAPASVSLKRAAEPGHNLDLGLVTFSRRLDARARLFTKLLIPLSWPLKLLTHARPAKTGARRPLQLCGPFPPSRHCLCFCWPTGHTETGFKVKENFKLFLFLERGKVLFYYKRYNLCHAKWHWLISVMFVSLESRLERLYYGGGRDAGILKKWRRVYRWEEGPYGDTPGGLAGWHRSHPHEPEFRGGQMFITPKLRVLDLNSIKGVPYMWNLGKWYRSTYLWSK